MDDYLATTVNDENLTCEIGEKRLICNNYLRSARPSEMHVNFKVLKLQSLWPPSTS